MTKVSKQFMKIMTNFGFWLVIFFSVSVNAKSLDNTQLYTVPSGKVWVVNDIQRNLCDVCTSDVYVQKGSVQLNEVWVSGSFDFSLMPNTKVSFESNTVFALGDVVKSINVDVINSGK